MQELIDQALETLLHSVIWRSTWHLQLPTLIFIGVVVFFILAYRRRNRGQSSQKKRYRSKFWRR